MNAQGIRPLSPGDRVWMSLDYPDLGCFEIGNVVRKVHQGREVDAYEILDGAGWQTFSCEVMHQGIQSGRYRLLRMSGESNDVS